MVLDDAAAYTALLARDARFDGRFFVGVTSTGVYCRPVCRVRTPKAENCRFFASAALAEAAAFRPCLKCRPEIAPGWSHADSSRSLADVAARRIEVAVQQGHELRLADLAAELGVTDRHLRRIFLAAHGVGPLDYWTTQRLLLAKRLLTDTRMAVGEVALAAGFGSVRRFNAAFAERYRLQPGRLRRDERLTGTARPPSAASAAAAAAAPTLRLAYRPPYDTEAVLAYFARRAVAGVEQVEGPALRRTLVLHDAEGAAHAGWLELRFVPERHEVHLRAAPVLAPVLGRLLALSRAVLDLDADPTPIDATLAALPLPLRPGARLPSGFDGFETGLRVILGQQVTVKAARTLIQRVVDRFGTPLATPWPVLQRTFPSAAVIAAAPPESLGELGIVRQRVRAIQALAAAVDQGQVALHRGAPLEATREALLALPGIGDWTAQVIAMRALAWPDAWPASDIGLMNALGSRDPRVIEARAEAWRPWRAYAVIRLWHHLESGGAWPLPEVALTPAPDAIPTEAA